MGIPTAIQVKSCRPNMIINADLWGRRGDRRKSVAAGIARVAATRAMNWPPCDYCSAVAKLALASI
jgi:hypothetical protein